MAFDAAASGNRPARSRASSAAPVAVGGGGEVDPAQLGQRVWTLNSTGNTIKALTAQLGTAADTRALRAKLAKEEAAAASLITELDAGVRKGRVSQMSSPDGGTAKRQFDRISEQYAQIRQVVVDAARVSQARQRQFVPADDPPGGGGGGGALPPAAALNDTRRQLRVGRGAGDAAPAPTFQPLAEPQQAVVLEMTAISDVDEALAQERAEAAAEIAATAVEVHGMMRDVSELVQEQAEAVNAVEARVDETLERVQAGNKELTKAAEYQSAYRKKMLLFALCLLALVGVIVIPIVIHYLPSITGRSGGGGGGGGGGGSPTATARALAAMQPAGGGAVPAGLSAHGR